MRLAESKKLAKTLFLLSSMVSSYGRLNLTNVYYVQILVCIMRRFQHVLCADFSMYSVQT